MIALGAHAEFIIAAYVGVFLCIAGLTAWTVIAARQSKRRLEELGDSARPGRSTP
jgi:heme exporter protein D